MSEMTEILKKVKLAGNTVNCVRPQRFCKVRTLRFFFLNLVLPVLLRFHQGRLDAMWALLRRQYDRVSLMRPTSEDKVSQQRQREVCVAPLSSVMFRNHRALRFHSYGPSVLRDVNREFPASPSSAASSACPPCFQPSEYFQLIQPPPRCLCS